MAVVDQSVEQGLGDDGVGEQRIPVHRGRLEVKITERRRVQ
jgi:hypothetical protein